MAEVELPDFNDLMALTVDVVNAKLRLTLNKAELDDRLSQITREVANNEFYFVKDKSPSMKYTEMVYHQSGRDEEERVWLLEKRVQIGNDEAVIKQKEMEYNISRDMINVWRTQQADRRGAQWDS